MRDLLRRGCLYWARLDKRRPVLVLSPEYRNELASDVIVVPCSSNLRLSPTHVLIRKGEGGVASASVLKCEQITTLHKGDVGRDPIGRQLSAKRLIEVELAVLRAIGVALPMAPAS